MAKRRKGAGPGGGEPDSRLEGSPEPGPARHGEGRQRRYTAEEKRALLEACTRSGMSVSDFCRTMGLGSDTLYRWRRLYEEHGPRGLEPARWGRPPGSGTGSRLPRPVQAAIVETKRRFPDFGLRRVRDYLARFLHLRVSEGGVATVVAAMDPPPPPAAVASRRRRRSEEPRRFERSRPGELWQSDITSYLLGRHHRRVYLTVFLDDFSRYVVAWNLQLHQRQELVTDCLLGGIEAFGKPREVLTDQGRQYFAWRGRSDFQRLLAKEGIQHVVARAHHPETVGKCERLWKTVGEELMERARPEDLEEARERLGHFFRHYNHFRPHQGLKGLTPADRFFGVEEGVRKEVLDAQARNALRLALGERPVARSFLVGSLDGQPVAVRTGRDGLVIETGDPAKAGGKDGGDGGREEAVVPQAHADRDAGAGGGAGAESLGGGERGGEEEGARDGGGDPEDLAREGDEGRGGGGAAGDGAPAVAAEPDGRERDGGRAAQAAARPPGPGALGGGGAEAEGGGAGEGARGDAGAGEDPRSDACPPRGEDPRCGTAGSEGTRSDAGSGSSEEACGEGGERSPGATA